MALCSQTSTYTWLYKQGNRNSCWALDTAAGQTYLQQQHENRSSEMMNQQSTWPCTTKLRDVIFWPIAPSTGHNKELHYLHTESCAQKYLVTWFQLQRLPQSLNGFCVFTLQGQHLGWQFTIKSEQANLLENETSKWNNVNHVYLAHAEKCFYVLWLVRESRDTRFKCCIIVVQFQLRGSHVVQTFHFHIHQFILLLRTDVDCGGDNHNNALRKRVEKMSKLEHKMNKMFTLSVHDQHDWTLTECIRLPPPF